MTSGFFDKLVKQLEKGFGSMEAEYALMVGSWGKRGGSGGGGELGYLACNGVSVAWRRTTRS